MYNKNTILEFLGYHKFNTTIKFIEDGEETTYSYNCVYYILNPSEEFTKTPIIYFHNVSDDYGKPILMDLNGKYNKFEECINDVDDFQFTWEWIMKCVEKLETIDTTPFLKFINFPHKGHFFLNYNGVTCKINMRASNIGVNNNQTTSYWTYHNVNGLSTFYRWKYTSIYEVYVDTINEFISWYNNQLLLN